MNMDRIQSQIFNNTAACDFKSSKGTHGQLVNHENCTLYLRIVTRTIAALIQKLRPQTRLFIKVLKKHTVMAKIPKFYCR